MLKIGSQEDGYNIQKKDDWFLHHGEYKADPTIIRKFELEFTR